jgi:hypothetical protein
MKSNPRGKVLLINNEHFQLPGIYQTRWNLKGLYHVKSAFEKAYKANNILRPKMPMKTVDPLECTLKIDMG